MAVPTEGLTSVRSFQTQVLTTEVAEAVDVTAAVVVAVVVEATSVLNLPPHITTATAAAAAATTTASTTTIRTGLREDASLLV